MNKSVILSGFVSVLFIATSALLWWEYENLSVQTAAFRSEMDVRLQNVSAERGAALKKSRELTETVKTQEREKKELSSQLADTKAAAAEISASSTSKINELTRQLDESKRETGPLKSNLESTKTELNTANAEIKTLKSEAAELEKKLTDARALVETTVTELSVLREESGVNTLMARIAELQTELEKIRASGIGGLQKQLKERDETIAALQAKVKALEEETAALKKQNEDLEKENRRLRDTPRRIGDGLGVPDYRGV
ncbi:MAG: hypothetical protein LBS59_04300 [Puniceicoccales bacterium]|jgi:chromosome segregation ATPase|nr:hypothetical protein [Puniceicoccales bacterium]